MIQVPKSHDTTVKLGGTNDKVNNIKIGDTSAKVDDTTVTSYSNY